MSSFLSRWAESIEKAPEQPDLPTNETRPSGVPNAMPVPCTDEGQPWSEWKAQSLNDEFKRLTGIRGRITGATVRHGERRRRLITAAPVHFASFEPANGYAACGLISAPGYATFDQARVNCPECRRVLSRGRR